MARYSRRGTMPMAPRTTAQQLAQDVARRSPLPAPASPGPAPAGPAAPTAMPAAAPSRAPQVNALAQDVARRSVGGTPAPGPIAFGGGVPDIPPQQPDLTPPRQPPQRPAPPPPAGSLQDPRAALGGGAAQPPFTAVTLEAAPGVLESVTGGGRSGPPYDSVTLEAAPGVLENINFDELTGGGAADKPFDEEAAIDQAIRDLLTEQPDVAAERAAMIDEMRANQARDIQSVRARTGLGGMGLTGAAGALESQVRQETGREQALTTAAFDRAAREEALRRLMAGVDLRRSEQVFEQAQELFGKEIEEEIPPLDSNGDGTVTDEERAAHDAAVKRAAETSAAETSAQVTAADRIRSSEIAGMSSAQFEGVSNTELERLGWTVTGPKGDDERGKWYYEWTGPNGERKRAYVDDAAEFTSGGLEWG